MPIQQLFRFLLVILFYFIGYLVLFYWLSCSILLEILFYLVGNLVLLIKPHGKSLNLALHSGKLLSVYCEKLYDINIL